MKNEQLILVPNKIKIFSELVNLKYKIDYNYNDLEFKKIIKSIREHILSLVNQDPENSLYETVLLGGPGIYGIESVLTSTLSIKDKIFIISNGKYGERIINICNRLALCYELISMNLEEPINIENIIKRIDNDKTISHVIAIHIENTGIINDIETLGKKINKINQNITFIVDCITSLGAYNINIEESMIHFLVSSSNKSLQSISGISIIVARRDKLLKSKWSKSFSLDLLGQWNSLMSFGKFRFTPPIHVIVILYYALIKLNSEGGPNIRYLKYLKYQKEIINKLIPSDNEKLKLYYNIKYIGPYMTLFKIDEKNLIVLENKMKENQIEFYKINNKCGSSIMISSIGDCKEDEIRLYLDKISDLIK